MNKQLPYLVNNVIKVLQLQDDADDNEVEKPPLETASIKTSTRQLVFLPVPGLVDVSKFRPGELVGSIRSLDP